MLTISLASETWPRQGTTKKLNPANLTCLMVAAAGSSVGQGGQLGDGENVDVLSRENQGGC